ncbi:hypothetical protein [uncultured Roseibium sp.]|uniref:hypothetical protein n=1 Tax=uncultured Roseibium sp. TaxID=1936171 RepID=UPI00321723A3
MASTAIKEPELWRRRLYVPFYKVSEAARYTHSSSNTVARWHRLSVLPTRQVRDDLSYMQLIELAVVAAMRRAKIPLAEIKAGRDYFARALGTEYPFATYSFKADGKRIVMDYQEIEPKTGLGKLIYSDGQLGWKEVVELLLQEFDYEEDGLAVRWHVGGIKSRVLIDPQLAFGSPNVSGVATWALKERYNGGESVSDLANDFDLEEQSVIDALNFEGIEPDFDRVSLWVN